jgi:hypothetical protein
MEDSIQAGGGTMGKGECATTSSPIPMPARSKVPEELFACSSFLAKSLNMKRQRNWNSLPVDT